MYGYKAWVYQAVYHDEKFSHTQETFQVVHANSEIEAREMVVLPEAQVKQASETLTIRLGAAYIRGITKLGRVKTKTIYEYEQEE